jgi:hypothetical protein
MKWILCELILLLFFINSISSQDRGPDPDGIYGPDPLLFNGRKYTFYVPKETSGQQYFAGPAFQSGSVTVKGVNFSADQLNYDIHNQQIVMKYESGAGVPYLLQLSKAWISAFSLGACRFELLNLPGRPQQICQVLDGGGLRILFCWSKTLDLDITHGSRKYVFSAPARQSYLFSGGQYSAFRNNKSFVALFRSEDQPALRKYMKSNKVNVRKSGDDKLTGLLNYCGDLGR